MVILAFLLLSIIMSVEVFVAYMRIYSIKHGSYAEGLTLNSAIALITRVITFMCIPMFAYLADTHDLTSDRFSLTFGFIFIPISILFCPFIFVRYGGFIGQYLQRIKGGSYFQKADTSEKLLKPDLKFLWQLSYVNLDQHNKITYYLIFVSYLLYYLTWPIVLLIASQFHEYRTTIFSLNTIFTALNTIVMTLFVDPKVTHLAAKSEKQGTEYLWVLINIRQVSSVVAYFGFLMFSTVI